MVFLLGLFAKKRRKIIQKMTKNLHAIELLRLRLYPTVDKIQHLQEVTQTYTNTAYIHLEIGKRKGILFTAVVRHEMKWFR